MPREVLPNASEDDIEFMETILAKGDIKHKYAVRLQAVINRAKGTTTTATATIHGLHPVTISKYVHRYNEGGIEALLRDRTRKPGKEPISTEIKNELCRIVCQEKPENSTHWSTRLLGERVGISHNAVSLILRERGLKPHLVQGFQFSTDPEFETKLEDVVGLYLDPPENSIVLCVDEKSQIQALDRTQPSLPLKKGRCGTMTHDYKGNGTTCLFAALSVLEGKVIGTCYPRHRNVEFRKFLRQIDREAPKDLDIHMILDNYGTHNHPQVRAWLGKHPRFHLHFTPTSSSWLNLIERWFGEITRKRIRRGVFKSVPELVAVINEYIRLNNQDPKPFVWTKKVDTILEKVARCKAITETLH